MSEGARAGREPPPVRLETVATATGLRSPATRLRGGDAPSPTAAGGAGGGATTKGVHCREHRSSGQSGCACLITSRVGVRARASSSVGTSRLPRGCSRRNRTPRVAANVEASQTLGLPREEEAWRLGLGSLPADYHR